MNYNINHRLYEFDYDNYHKYLDWKKKKEIFNFHWKQTNSYSYVLILYCVL